jgi:peptidoglycan/LPS O-acetylase OafA/YrhL
MGTLRLLLAIAVVLGHVDGVRYVMTGGENSVQCFYIISGFFISLILDQKYNKKGDLKLFYSNRFIRIFSVYWFFLALAFAMGLAWRQMSHRGPISLILQNRAALGARGLVFLVLSNVLLLGQDWTLFLKISPAHAGLEWTTNFRDSVPLVSSMLLVPPAWSLGIELSFYGIAPFLTRLRGWMIGLLIAASLLLRICLHRHGLDFDPWSYRFFPFEIALFLAGTLSYRLYKRIRERTLSLPWKLFGCGVFPLILAFQLYDRSGDTFFAAGRLFLYGYLILALPALFHWTGRIKLDRALGEASYPLYLCHVMVLDVVARFGAGASRPWMQAALTLGISLGIAFLTARYLDEPIDRFRQLRIKRYHRES